ncbi:MAG: hypothetical protein LBE33_10255 [Zoogloeaceae bacterium]|jgi:hypothetical protein|nr:hypothetical protein [Zoogloeaceae bacterium]
MDPITLTILSRIIDSIIESALAPAPLPPPSAPVGMVRPALHNGMLAVMEPPENGHARFGNETLPLSASLQIRNTQNLIVMPMAIRGPAPVLYKLDQYGTVQRVWILTPEEAEAADQIIRQKQRAAPPPQ